MDITHLHLHTRDRAAAVAFYTRWLGLRVTSAGEAITFMQGDRGFLLALMDDPAPAAMPAWFHFGVALASAQRVAATLEAMRAASVPIARDLYCDDTLASFRCRDPDGYAIEVYWEAA